MNTRDPHDIISETEVCTHGHLARSCEACSLKRELHEVTARSEFADELLERVMIRGGAGTWTESEMRDWCCDYKDHRLGFSPAWIKTQGHAICRHRTEREDCGPVLDVEKRLRAELHETRGERDEARTANAVLLDNDGIALEVVRLHALLAAATEHERGLREALGEVMSWINNWGPVFTDEEEWDETAAMVTAALAAGAEGEKA